MQAELKHHFDRLEKLKSDTLQYFSNYGENALNAPPAPGKWGALQHMAHIISSETKGLGYMMKKIQAADKMGSAGAREKFMNFLLKTFLRTGIKFKAPAVLDEPAEHYTVDEVFSAWDKLRLEYAAFLATMDERLAHKLIYKHPMAGRLSPVQALEFMVIHLNRHIVAAKKGLK
jgi:hypothetical protein